MQEAYMFLLGTVKQFPDGYAFLNLPMRSWSINRMPST